MTLALAVARGVAPDPYGLNRAPIYGQEFSAQQP
jgi:hypothetical protein